jgi:tRNA threonylcarbamoyladenosine biosynthesis protein TsaE
MRVDTNPIELLLPDLAATHALARGLAAVSRPGDVLALTGALGLGKTEFARAFIRTLSGADEEVPSPTFTLVQLYEGTAGMIWHFDLYRLARPEDVWELGFEDALAGGLLLIEWPERLGPLLPRRRLDLTLLPSDKAGARRAILMAAGGCDLFQRWAATP